MKITPTISTEPDTWSVIRDYARDNSDHNTSQWARGWLLAAVLYEQRHDGPPSWIDAETIGGLDIDDDDADALREWIARSNDDAVEPTP